MILTGKRINARQDAQAVVPVHVECQLIAAGPLQAAPEHLARLHRSADGLGIVLPAGLEQTIGAAIAQLIAAEAMDGPDGDASIRITVSRGAFAGRGLLPPDETVEPTIVVQAY